MLPSIAGALAGAITGFVTSYLLHVRLVPKVQRLSELRLDFYEFLRLVTEYWLASPADRSTLAQREARILAQQEIIKIKFRDLSGVSGRIARAHQTTLTDRLELWSTATGGSFQSADWSSDPERPKRAIAAVGRIVAKLPR